MASLDPERCPTCGAARPANAPRGLCPRCLLRDGLDGPALSLSHPGTLGATVDLGGSAVLETIAAGVGPVPRVLLRDTDPGAEPPIVRSPDRAAAEGSLRYRIDGEIARGGMGEVLKGRDADLGRDVAVKVLRDDLSGRPEMVRRFIEEAQIGGQLQHPGIVPVYELGTFADRRPFFSMKLVKGQTLAALLAARPSPSAELPRLLGIFEQVAQTVAYAHARGVIHRDLKPSNVMVGSFGEVQVMDWGLAKVLPRGGVADDAAAGKAPDQETVIATARSGGEQDAELSQAGSIMGTPSYMAPEQARGDVEAVDERADVFALGSILCEVLTGQPAFTGRSSGEIQRKAARADTAESLARLNACGLDAALVGLAGACLAAEAMDRPRDAGAVSGRVTAYLAGVQERLRGAEIERARAKAKAAEERRRRLLQVGLAASLLAFLSLAGLAGAYVLHQRQARAARMDRLLAEATLLRDEAHAKPDVVYHWERAREAVGRTAEELGPSSAPLAELRRDVEAGLGAAEADRDLVTRLVEIRSIAGDDPDGSATDAAYARVFTGAGIDPDHDDPAGAGARVAGRPKPVNTALVAALDHWAAVRRGRASKGQGWARVMATAAAANPDPDRDALRAALLVEDRAKRLDRLRPLVERADAGSWAPASLILLGEALAEVGDLDAGAAVLRRASWSHPKDAWVHHSLGRLLEQARPPQPEEAIRAYSLAWGVEPELAGHDLAHALDRHGREAEAEPVWRDLVGRRPGNGRDLGCYGRHLRTWGRLTEAAPVLARAVAADREAIRIRPDDAQAHTNLGSALGTSGDLAGAIAAYREAIRLKPDLAIAHCNLGNVLRETGDLAGAIAEYREAIRQKPDLTDAHAQLGAALGSSGDVRGAITEYREAIRQKPDSAEVHGNLGNALRDTGDLPGAIAAFREAVRLRPDIALSHKNLGAALEGTGDLPGAIATYREAVRLWAEALDTHPKLAEDRRAQHAYNAACAAVLAAASGGRHETQLDPAVRAELRSKALGWLKGELEAWSKAFDGDDPKARAAVAGALLHWKQDPDLAGVRDAVALAALPEAERTGWEALWAEVNRLLGRVEESH